MKYQVIEKDPTEPIQGTRWLRPDREADIDRQIAEVVAKMTADLVFEVAAEELEKEISRKITEIDKEIATPVKGETSAETKLRLERLTDKREYQVSRSRTPDQLAEEKRIELKVAAIGILTKPYNERMKGRLAQFWTTCRLDGCEKQPRTGLPSNGTNQSKNRRRTFVFCPGHAGVRNQISKADYKRLQSNHNLRVVAE